MEFQASLEAVKTRKNVTDDVIQTVVFNIYGTPEEVAALLALYRQPIKITVEKSA
jgi:hypothetical protein